MVLQVMRKMKWSCRRCRQDCYQKCCSQGKSILHVNDFSEFSNDKFDACDSPTYSMKLADTEKINEERELKPDTRDFPQ